IQTCAEALQEPGRQRLSPRRHKSEGCASFESRLLEHSLQRTRNKLQVRHPFSTNSLNEIPAVAMLLGSCQNESCAHQQRRKEFRDRSVKGHRGFLEDD